MAIVTKCPDIIGVEFITTISDRNYVIGLHQGGVAKILNFAEYACPIITGVDEVFEHSCVMPNPELIIAVLGTKPLLSP
ncbi:hypothetical protein LCGC14_1492000 [marine sediment metagenome]|uniref:Uncharacterized protein n=1 Tax=marine sediment metagenome TaxID=412755 RepID=A0A0F9J778_9ZZZZ